MTARSNKKPSLNKGLADRIKSVMAVIFEIKASNIQDKTSPDTVENWDSLHHMNMVVALEEEFSIKFDDDEIPNLLNFAIIRSSVDAQVNK